MVSIVIVSDYAGGESKAWEELRLTLRGLANQDFDEPVEYILCESIEAEGKIPEDLVTILPSLKIELYPAAASYELKNAGVKSASAEIVATLDGDCVPQPNWLRHLVTSLRTDQDAVVVSGKTVYAEQELVPRVLALLSRAYLDPGRNAGTRFISNNNAAFRRSVYLAHPLPTNAGPFAARMQSEAVRRSGGKMLFDSRMQVVHDFEGWPMEKDIRRNIGFGTVITRRIDGTLPYSWLVRLGIASIPLIVVGKTIESLWDCVRCGRQYGVRLFELPIAFLLAVVVHWMEIPGMISAFRGQPITQTAYR